MAKNKNSKSSKNSTNTGTSIAADYDADEPDDFDAEAAGESGEIDESDYESKADDLKGFADPRKGKVHIKLLHANAIDNGSEKSKPSVLLIGELLTRRGLSKDGEAVQGEPGDRIGIWYKPGMAPALKHAGVPMVIEHTGQTDTGKPQPMNTYDVRTKGDGLELQLVGDYRKDSRGAKLPLESWNKPAKSGSAQPAAGSGPSGSDDTDDLPF